MDFLRHDRNFRQAWNCTPIQAGEPFPAGLVIDRYPVYQPFIDEPAQGIRKEAVCLEADFQAERSCMTGKFYHCIALERRLPAGYNNAGDERSGPVNHLLNHLNVPEILPGLDGLVLAVGTPQGTSAKEDRADCPAPPIDC